MVVKRIGQSTSEAPSICVMCGQLRVHHHSKISLPSKQRYPRAEPSTSGSSSTGTAIVPNSSNTSVPIPTNPTNPPPPMSDIIDVDSPTGRHIHPTSHPGIRYPASSNTAAPGDLGAAVKNPPRDRYRFNLVFHSQSGAWRNGDDWPRKLVERCFFGLDISLGMLEPRIERLIQAMHLLYVVYIFDELEFFSIKEAEALHAGLAKTTFISRVRFVNDISQATVAAVNSFSDIPVRNIAHPFVIAQPANAKQQTARGASSRVSFDASSASTTSAYARRRANASPFGYAALKRGQAPPELIAQVLAEHIVMLLVVIIYLGGPKTEQFCSCASDLSERPSSYFLLYLGRSTPSTVYKVWLFTGQELAGPRKMPGRTARPRGCLFLQTSSLWEAPGEGSTARADNLALYQRSSGILQTALCADNAFLWCSKADPDSLVHEFKVCCRHNFDARHSSDNTVHFESAQGETAPNIVCMHSTDFRHAKHGYNVLERYQNSDASQRRKWECAEKPGFFPSRKTFACSQLMIPPGNIRGTRRHYPVNSNRFCHTGYAVVVGKNQVHLGCLLDYQTPDPPEPNRERRWGYTSTCDCQDRKECRPLMACNGSAHGRL
ncbi:hypothetical protein B0H14DRAFT_3671381 [Mycena olivaceomarginata]|nr:hypothetical protein B0H14DRAFT_3671381 [Mycena olivaceomarginata]